MSNRFVPLHLFLISLVSPFMLSANAALPSIDYAPRSQAVILYQQAAFGVIASGTPPLSYQWRKDGVPIVGATNDQFVLKQPQFADTGNYSVAVSNAEGSVISSDAMLTLTPPKAGDVDYSFTTGTSIDDRIVTVAFHPEGKIVIGGDFTRVHGVARSRIARLNSDGTVDHTFLEGQRWTPKLRPVVKLDFSRTAQCEKEQIHETKTQTV